MLYTNCTCTADHTWITTKYYMNIWIVVMRMFCILVILQYFSFTELCRQQQVTLTDVVYNNIFESDVVMRFVELDGKRCIYRCMKDNLAAQTVLYHAEDGNCVCLETGFGNGVNDVVDGDVSWVTKVHVVDLERSAPGEQCAVDEASRVQCLHSNTNQFKCKKNLCCWDALSSPSCFYSHYEESGFMAQNRGCVPPGGATSVDAVAVTRHQCALLCLSTAVCEKYDYHFTSSPPVCKMYSTTCRSYNLMDVHSYDKVAATDYRCRRGDCAGSDTRSMDANTQDCRDECDNEPDCVLFFTTRLFTMCFLKTATCDTPNASTQPGVSCDKDQNGVMYRAEIDIDGLITPGDVRDGDFDTCVDIPTIDSAAKFLHFRMSWPVHSGEGPNFNVQIVGSHSLLCSSDFMVIDMKIGATWGDPSFDGPRHPCVYLEEHDDVFYRHCYFYCEPAPDFSEALFVSLFNYEDAASICEVNFY